MRRLKTVIGLDIGTRAVKAVEMSWASGGPVITGFGYAPLPNPQAVPETVLRVLQENSFHTRQVVTSVSGKSVIVRYLTMLKMSRDDLRSAIRFEADKYIPFDVEEVVLDCHPFEADGMGDLAENETRVLLVACKRAIIDEQMRVLAEIGLEPLVVDVDVFALGNAFETAIHRATTTPLVTALVDIGASKTSVNLMRAGTSLFTREIHTGGDAITQVVATRLAMHESEAEVLKCNPGAESDRLRHAVGPALDDLASEVRLSFEYFENQFEMGIDEVLLSGGGARLGGLEEHLGRVFGRPTLTWDPTGDLPIAGGSVNVEALHERTPELAVAVGLASRIRKDAR